MSGELHASALLREVEKMTATNASPYYRVAVIIKAGGKEITPLQFNSLVVDDQYRTSYTSTLSLTVSLGTGTLMNDIGPFQDDLKITLSLQTCDEDGTPYDDPIEVRTYKAYLADHIPRPIDSGYRPHLGSTETANWSISPTVFELEEVAVEQLRKQSFGTIFPNAVPGSVAAVVLDNYRRVLKLGDDEVLTNVDIVTPDNTTPRNHIVIKQPTPVLEIPDLLQNEEGGIYSSGLGFFITGQTIWLWPLYDVTRQASAKHLLRIVLSPSKHGTILDRTWHVVGRVLTILSSGITRIMDDTLGNLNIHGNGVRFSDAGKLMEDFGTVEGNKLTLSRSLNNNEYISTVVGNGENHATLSDVPFTTNVYNEASKRCRLSGAIAVIPWRRSAHTKLKPGMAVEIDYEYNGDLRTIEGVLIGTTTTITLEGHGMTAARQASTTVLMVYISRDDPDYIAYLNGGGTLSASPEIQAF